MKTPVNFGKFLRIPFLQNTAGATGSKRFTWKTNFRMDCIGEDIASLVSWLKEKMQKMSFLYSC